MHMADALLSPVVGGAFFLTSLGIVAFSAKKIKEEGNDSKTPLMGVLGAFIFAAQMINFSIPGTGSSGHLGGGLLLSVLLGPYRAFITLTSVLIIQCLFFADGGFLALGCNIFNIAFLPAFIAYPFVFKLFLNKRLDRKKLFLPSLFAACAGLLIGSFSVVIQTTLSGITDLPFKTFLLFMIPIHLAIGIVEGLVTWSVLSFILKTQPELIIIDKITGGKKVVLSLFMIATLLMGGFLSFFASESPDGLEWSIVKVSGTKEIQNADKKIYEISSAIQEKISFLPDYSFRKTTGTDATTPINLGTGISGIIGSLLTLLLAGIFGLIFRRRNTKEKIIS